MEHFMRIAFWIFTLSVTLSDCHPIMADYKIKLMMKLECAENGQFYTPEPTNACRKSALKCIFVELNGTANAECHDPDEHIRDGLVALQILITKMPEDPAPSNTSACACEQWPQKSFAKFLEKYQSLLERENTAAAGR